MNKKIEKLEVRCNNRQLCELIEINNNYISNDFFLNEYIEKYMNNTHIKSKINSRLYNDWTK